MQESIKIIGIFKIKIFKKGVLIEEYEDRNTVVNGGKETIAQMLGNITNNKHITQISIGTNNSPPSTSDTVITEPFVKSITEVKYPSQSSIRFIFDIASIEANPKSVREFGLLSNDGTLFARKTRDVIEKDADISIEGEWTINFV